MPPKKDRGTKTETLSLRLDPKTKFILEFVGRINGQTFTTIVERAIRASCGEVWIGNRFNWEAFWDPNDGVRTLKLLACSDYPSSYDEDDLKHFTTAHHEFFYTSREAENPYRPYVQILWPKIDEYRRIWHDHRETDYWAAGKAMAADLSSAKVEPPEWPRPARKRDFIRREQGDDEIPF
jgi:hypothetical protein